MTVRFKSVSASQKVCTGAVKQGVCTWWNVPTAQVTHKLSSVNLLAPGCQLLSMLHAHGIVCIASPFCRLTVVGLFSL